MINWLKKRNHQPDTRPDETLVTLSQKGDREAFGQLYLRHLDSMYRFVYFRVGQEPNTAENLTEVVFTKSWKSLRTYSVKKSASFRSWLYQIARNAIVDHFRRHRDHVELNTLTLITTDSPESLAMIHDSVEMLQRALGRLPEVSRDVILMRYIDALDYEEIAQITGKSEIAVRAIASRGLKSLKKVLQDDK